MASMSAKKSVKKNLAMYTKRPIGSISSAAKQ